MYVYVYMYMYIHTHIVCFEGEKKAQKFSPPAAGETPDPCHLSGPEMISYTFRHHTPSDTIHLGLPGGAAGAMDNTFTKDPHTRTRTNSVCACVHSYIPCKHAHANTNTHPR